MKIFLLKFLVIAFVFSLTNMLTAQNNFPDNWKEIIKQHQNMHVLNMNMIAGTVIDGDTKTITAIYDVDDYVVLEVLVMEWEGGVWVYQMKMVYTYDANWFLIEFFGYVWEEDAWSVYMKAEYTNNASGQPIESLLYLWNQETGVWDLISKNTYTYDGNGNLIEQLSQTWIVDQWINSHKLLYTYDVNYNLIEELELAWDFINNIWENFDIHYYTYENNLLMEDLKQLWWQGAWENEYNTFWTYDGGGHATERLKKSWEGGAWVNFLHNTYTYNASWQEIEEFVEIWESGAWVNHEMYYKTYDVNGNMIELLIQVWEAKGWVNESKQTINYGLVGINEYSSLNNSDFNLVNYPNPFNNSTTIEFDLFQKSNVFLSIYDINGRLITTLVNEEKDAGSYSVVWEGKNEKGNCAISGVYFYKISTDKLTETKRMILF